jgi:hypothetical protein
VSHGRASAGLVGPKTLVTGVLLQLLVSLLSRQEVKWRSRDKTARQQDNSYPVIQFQISCVSLLACGDGTQELEASERGNNIRVIIIRAQRMDQTRFSAAFCGSWT